MSAEGLRAFFSALATQGRTRNELEKELARLPRDADLATVVAEFAISRNYAIEAPDLLTIDTVFEPLREQKKGRAAEAVRDLAAEYLEASGDPGSFNALGYYDPKGLKLWRTF